MFLTFFHTLHFILKLSQVIALPIGLQIYCKNVPTLEVFRFHHQKEATDDVVTLCAKHDTHFIDIRAKFKNPRLYPFVESVNIVDTCELKYDYFDDIYFVPNQTIYLGMMSGLWQWLGVNQVWLGCPQPFCFMADMDAAVASVRTMLIARGRQICKLNINKNRILPPEITDCFEDDITFFDFGVYFESSMYLVKGKKYKKFSANGVLHDNQTMDKELKVIYDEVKHMSIDAAIANDYVVILYKGDKAMIYKFGNSTLNKQISTIKIKNLDAAVYIRQQQKAFVFKGSHFYADDFGETDEKSPTFPDIANNTIEYFFNCDAVYANTSFHNFTGFTNFRKQFDNFPVPKVVIPTTVTEQLIIVYSDNSLFLAIIAISIVMILSAIVAFLVVKHKLVTKSNEPFNEKEESH